ncbi:MAG: hypothetical protein ACI4N3_02505 [Alphaproteobacteria bacterium]
MQVSKLLSVDEEEVFVVVDILLLELMLLDAFLEELVDLEEDTACLFVFLVAACEKLLHISTRNVNVVKNMINLFIITSRLFL